MGQTPLDAPEYAIHDTYVVNTVNHRFVGSVVRHGGRSPSSMGIQGKPLPRQIVVSSMPLSTISRACSSFLRFCGLPPSQF
jgi:hypothetical protein